MIEITESARRFVICCLSEKSQQYIQNELFASEYLINKILREIPKSQIDNEDLLIGELSDSEAQLFIIKQSLSKRIAGTERRIGEVNRVSILDSQSEIKGAMDLYYQREARLRELRNDYKQVYFHLNSLIESRLGDIICSALEKNPLIIKSSYNGFDSGFDFKILNKNNIVLINTSVLGGD